MDESRVRDLKARARAGDRAALQELRDAGFFARKEEKGWDLSHAQKRLWVIDRMMEGGSAAYNIPVALRLTGSLDADALRRALSALVARHESLRTAFREVEGVPRQFIVAPPDIELPLHDLSGTSDPEAAARAAVARDAEEPFDLARAPLLRARLFRLDPASHVLLLNIHHIVFDERSTSVFVKDLAALYRAFRAGAASALPPLAIQYKDYAAWQAKRLAGPEAEALRAYWRGKLGGRPEPLALPLDRPRPAVQAFEGDLVERALDPGAFGRLEEIARARGMSAFMALVAALEVLFHRVTGSEEIVIGTTAAGRDRKELEGQIGFYVNALALRDALAPSLTFDEVLGRARATCMEAYEHQAYPFDRLVEELELERDLSRSPLFDVMLVVSDEGTPILELEDLSISLFDAGRVSAKFDLTFDFVRAAGGWTLRIIYATRLFDRDRIERLADLLGRIVAEVTSAPARAIGEIDLVGPEEREILEGLSRGPVRDRPCDRSIVDLFDEQVARTPDAPAAGVPGAPPLSYRRLRERSIAIAEAIAGLADLAPGDRIALRTDRGVDRIAAILGIMRAGCAYLPIDPALPDERCRFLLEDSGARAVLVEDRFTGGPIGVPVIGLADLANGTRGIPVAPAPGDVAYVIYTSGSTGAPKGVEVRHDGFVNMILAQVEAFGIVPADAVVQFASASFDASLSEIFMALLAGARLVLPDDETLKNPADLVRVIREERITVATIPPPYIRILGWEKLKALRCLITAGEEAVPDAGALTECGTRYWNAYGPTEFSVCATMGLVDPRVEPPARVPIGRPIANCAVHILEPGGTALRPLGLDGEICLAGPGLARGYLGRPSLTAEKFVTVDLAGRGPVRLYRTGDLGRWRPDGTIEFLGRVDHQVKVRGYRVEPGEIESALRRLEGVREAAVVARDAELVAYVVADGSTARGAADLRAALARGLPPYMIPEHFVFLDALPRTASGKLDRKALPAAVRGDAGGGTSSRAPRNESERRLLAVWNEVLGTARTGVEERFLDLGGNSLKAILLVSRVLSELGARITIRDVFERGTVASLAERLRLAGGAPGFAPIPPAPPASDHALSHAQRRLWTIERMGEGVGAYHIPGALAIRGPLDPDRLRAALEALAVRHESLRTVFRERDGEPRQVVLDRVPLDFEIVDRRGAEPGAVDEAAIRGEIEEDSHRLFDLEKGPLFRVRLFRTGASAWILYLNMHHIVSDGWSIEVLFRDLLALYGSGTGDGARLPALRVHYKDFAAWQNERLSAGNAAASRDHWTRVLGDEIPVLDLPSDRPRPAVRSFRGSSVVRRLDAALSRRLREEARRRDATPAALWLALLYQLLHRVTGAPEIVVGMPATFREHPDLEHQVGFFVNMLPLRLSLDPSESSVALLGRTSDLLRESFAHKDYPYDRLVEELAIRRDMGRNPLFDVVLSVQEQGRQEPGVPGLATSPFPFASRTSKFDLTVFASEDAAGAWEVTLEFDTALFDEERIARLAGQFERLLASVLDAPDRPVGEQELMTAAERHAVLETFAGIETAYPRDRSMAAVFEDIAATHPDREAVATERGSLTYAALNGRANLLARRLRDDHGLRPEEPVGLLLRRSERTAIALLGILKAGGAYLPLDPAAPTARTRFLLADAGCRLVISEEEFAATVLAGLPGVVTVGMKTLGDGTETNLPAVGSSSSLAYIMYTSGSTGEPKGSLIEQKSVLRLVLSTNYIALDPGHRILQTGSLAFDASTFEFWGALLNGGTICLPPENALLEVTEFGALVERFRATTAWLTASLFNQMVEADSGVFRGLTHLLTGGERLSAPHVKRVREAFPNLVLINGYGPTENTTFTACHRIEAVDTGDIPIGRPIANTKVWILDRALRPVPIGVPGEICAGGDGLSRGYLNRPELTAEKFVTVEIGGVPRRLYRTGDVGWWNTDGTLSIAGRLDDQVKIRGFRVEIGEVEAALRRVPGVADAAVVPRRTAIGTTELVGYCAAAPDVDPGVIRGILGQDLPAYMIPSHIVRLDRLPLTPNGKIDKRALPGLSGERAPGPVAEARGPAEEALLAAWRDLLGRPVIGRDENYFDLGGDSIRAIQVVSRMRKAGWNLKVRDLFSHPTAAALASCMTPYAAGIGRDEDPGGPAPLTPIQRWFVRVQGRVLPRFNQSVMLGAFGAGASDAVDEERLRGALVGLVERHAMLRAVFRASAAGVVQETAAPADPALEVVDLRGAPDPDAALAAYADRVQGSIDPERGPILRVLLARRAGGDRVLVVVHHLAIDGVSWRILLEDLEALYRGGAVEAPTASFGAWARRWEARVSEGAFDGEREFWSAIVASGAAPLSFDIEDAPPGTFGDAATVEMEFGPEETRQILEEGLRAFGAGADVLLLAALGRALRAWQGRDETLIALESHGRAMERVGLDVARTVGWFTAIHPFRLALSGASIGDEVMRVKEDLRRIPDEGLGFGALDIDLPPSISFNYLGRFGSRDGGDEAFAFAGESRGREIAPEAVRSHHLDVSGLVAGDRLGLSITYSGRRYRRATMEALAASLRGEVLAVAGHCAARACLERTPSDFSSRVTSHWTLDEYRLFLAREGIPAGEVEDVLPLTPMQEGFLFQRRLDPGSSAYQLQMTFRLRGALDVAAYREAWSDLVRRHAILRTSFHDEERGRPVQVVRSMRTPEFRFEDLSGLDDASREARLAEFRKGDLARRFDLARDPLLRIAVFSTGPDRYESIWSYHHILLDGWSLGVLYRELTEAYAARAAGRVPDAVPSRPFAAFVRWLEERDRDAGAAFWRESLAGFEEATMLAPPVETASAYDFRETIVEAPEGLTGAVADLAARLGVTSYSVMQAAWSVVLSRHAGADDVVFGSVVSGRPPGLLGVEETVGLFINAIPVRARVSGEATFASLARDLQAAALAAEEHHHVPLAEIQKLASPGVTLFDHILVYENYPVDREVADGTSAGRSGLAVEAFEAHDESHYDLNLVLIPGDRLQLRFSYNGRVHDPDRVERLAGHLLAALAAGVAEPEHSVAAIEILPEADRIAIAAALRGPARTAPAPGTFLDLFAAAVAREPGAAAVRADGVTRSYRDLDEESSRLASWIRDRIAPRPDDRIGILLDRSDRLVVALLAVMKAGAAYVPIDPAYPPDRIAHIAGDSASRAVITDERHAHAAGPGRIRLDEVWGEAMATPIGPLPPPDPASLAYVIYTSGSTGRPKGCAIEHRNLAHYLEWAARAYFTDASAGSFGLFTSLSFDLTVTSLFLPLVRGRTLVVAPPAAETHEALRAMLDPGNEVDALKITPSHIAMIPDLGIERTNVALAVVGGEALRPEQVAILHRLNPAMAVWNEYGPTETTVGCIVKRVEPGARAITIGRPIDETSIALLDASRRPVPLGARGEIWIGGAGVGRGYLGRPDLTAERFVEIDGRLMYRTGDRGLLRADGDLDYLGRADDQVKIRGHRIEPGEVEEAIGALPFVKDCAVVARRDAAGETRLVACVVYRDRRDEGRVPVELARVLPAPLVPSAFVTLDRLPLTPNGKVDRKALPDPFASAAGAACGEAPRPGLEEEIAAIWREVLGVETVGRTDSFFALGGHSLKATQVVSRILRRLERRVPLAAFIREPTIENLARIAATEDPGRGEDRIPRAPSAPDYALSHAQHRLWLLHHIEGGETAYNMPFAFRARNVALDERLLEAALAALIARHEALRTAFVVRDGEPRQEILASCPFRIGMQRLEPGVDVEARIREFAAREARTPFDLASPPLMRLTVVRGPEDLFVLFTMHHIVGDGWSGLVLARELMTLYDAAATGRAPALAPLTVHYKDFSEWQNAKGFAEDEAYWLGALENAPERIALPYDSAPGPLSLFQGDVVRVRLDAATTARLRGLAAARNTTLSNVTLALFGLLLNRLTAQDDLVVGLSVANRNHPDLEHLIGFFVNMLPIRFRFEPDMELEELVDRTARTTTAAFAHQDYPFDRLVRRINPDRLSNRQPLLNVVYAFQNFGDVKIEAGETAGRAAPPTGADGAGALEPVDFTFGTSKFDLTLFAAEEADGLALVLEYDSSLFRRESAERMLATYARFCGRV